MNIKDDFVLSQINQGYLVGGAVRDFLMGKNEILDRDIAIKKAEKFAKELSQKLDATFITLDDENKIYRIVLKDKLNFLDISELQGTNIEEDLLRRDFTINAIAYDLKKQEFIDVTGGLEDIKNKKLRGIREENFQGDPLRILRAFRFMATTGFEFDKNLDFAIEKYKSLTLNPAKERITYELMKLFGGKNCSNTLLKMEEFNLLEAIFPFVAEMKLVPPNSHHHLDLLHHSIETVKQIEKLYSELGKEAKNHMDSIDFGGFPRINHLKLAGFLHDIGKYSTWTIEEIAVANDVKLKSCHSELVSESHDNQMLKQVQHDKKGELNVRHRFIKHNDVGAEMVVPYLKSMKFSKKQIEYISEMIKQHIYPSNVISAPDLSEKVMMRYIRKIENNAIDNILLAKADRLSARGVEITDKMVEANINGLNKLQEFYLAKKETLKPLPKLLDGREIMELKNISQSPLLGQIVNALKEGQMNGDVVTKEDAIEFVKNYQ